MSENKKLTNLPQTGHMTIYWSRRDDDAPSLPCDTAQTLTQLLRSEELDALIDLARTSFGCAAATVSIMGERQWFLSSSGHDLVSSDRSGAICNRTIGNQGITIIEDLTVDPEFAEHPLVATEAGLRFYAGLPLLIEQDFFSMDVTAAFCIVDHVARRFTAEERVKLEQFASIARSLIEFGVRSAGTRGRVAKQNELVEKLVRKQVQFRQAEKMALMGHWRLDFISNNIEWSEGVYEIYGLPLSDEPPLEQALSFYEPESRARLELLIERAITAGEAFAADFDFVTQGGERRRVRTVGEIECQDGRAVALIGVFRDMTERFQLERKLRRAAQTDPMTGLGNRAGLRAFFENRETGETLSIMLLDLDGFKQVNDQLGHMTGDKVIKAMARTLRRTVPAPHFVGRFGGDEFIVVLIDSLLGDNRNALVDRIAGKMVHDVAGDAVSLRVSASMGLYEMAQGESLEHALGQADVALYADKQTPKMRPAAD